MITEIVLPNKKGLLALQYGKERCGVITTLHLEDSCIYHIAGSSPPGIV
jgi:hypothetical protein